MITFNSLPVVCWRLALAVVFVGLLAQAPSAHAQDGRSTANRVQFYPLATPPNGGTDPGSSGFAAVFNNPKGPDTLVAFFRGLAPGTCYSAFLTQSIVTGSTPGFLIAGFCSDGAGRGRIRVLTEVVDSFVFFNNQLDDDGDGIVVGQGAGVLANGGFMVPTPIVRVYRAQPDQGVATVFSADSRSPGGLHTLSSTPIR